MDNMKHKKRMHKIYKKMKPASLTPEHIVFFEENIAGVTTTCT